MAEVVPQDDRQPEVSLNDGAELEDEVKEHNAGIPHEELFGEYTPGEVPDLKKDVVLIQALEAQIQDLTYLRQDLLRAQGMNQGFAMEAQRLLPDFDGQAPLGFYTKETSATRYQVALEEVHRGIWMAIAALAAAIIAAVMRLVQWLRGRSAASSTTANKSQQASENVKKLDEAQERVQEVRKAVTSGEAVTVSKTGEPEKLITLTSIIEDTWTDQQRYEWALKFLQLQDPVLRDIVLHGPYSQAVQAVMHGISPLRHVLEGKVDALAEVARVDRATTQQADMLFNERMLKLLDDPLVVRFNGQDRTLEDLTHILSEHRAKLHTPAGSQHALTFDQMVDAVVRAYRAADLAKFFHEQQAATEVFEKLETTLQHVQKTSGDLSRDGTTFHNNEGVAGKIRAVLLRLSKDVAAYRLLYAELSYFGMHMDHMAEQAVGFANEIEQQLYAMALRGTIKLPEDWAKRSSKTRIQRINTLFSKHGE